MMRFRYTDLRIRAGALLLAHHERESTDATSGRADAWYSAQIDAIRTFALARGLEIDFHRERGERLSRASEDIRRRGAMIAVRGSHKGWVCLLSLPLLPLSEAAAQSERCVQPPPGLISWWPGDGDFVDIQDGNSASLHSGVTFDAGKVGQGFEFTGTGGQFIDIPSAPNLQLQRFTLDAWVRPDGPGPNNDLFGSGIIKKNLPPPLGNTTVSVDLSWSASQSKSSLILVTCLRLRSSESSRRIPSHRGSSTTSPEPMTVRRSSCM